MASEQPEKGDKGDAPSSVKRITQMLTPLVSWQWGGGAPGGKVVETKDEGELAIKSKRGNTIKKNASPSNPAVHVGREGNDVVKRASELNVEDKKSGAAKSKSPAPDKKKRDHDEADEDAKATDKAADKKKEPAAKKQKKEPAKKADDKQANGDAPKKARGRPKSGTSAPKKKKEPKPRATEGIGSRTRSRA